MSQINVQDGDKTEQEVAHDLRDSNLAVVFIKESEDEANNPIVNGKDHSDKKLQRRDNESLAKYNERVTPGTQPVQPAVTRTYLGDKL